MGIDLDIEKIESAYTPTFHARAHLQGRASVTRHIRRTRRIRPAADAQLPVVVGAPALDPAPALNRARVVITQGDGDGEETCREKSREGEVGLYETHIHATARARTYCNQAYFRR